MTVDQSSVGEWGCGSGMRQRRVGQALSQAVDRTCRDCERTAIGEPQAPLEPVKKPHFPKVDWFPKSMHFIYHMETAFTNPVPDDYSSVGKFCHF